MSQDCPFSVILLSHISTAMLSNRLLIADVTEELGGNTVLKLHK